MKIVAVSQRVDRYTDREECRDGVDQRLISLILATGFLPAPIPNCFHLAPDSKKQSKEAFEKWIKTINPAAILLSGGNDIGEFPDRDIVEDWLLDHAEKNKLPALGICRGMQMMAVRYGAKLDLVDGHVGTHHYLTGVIKGRVNSYHNQGILECPQKFRSLAWSEDGNIEAIGHEFLPWEGWMWHPERELIFSPRDIERLKALFK